MADFTPFDVRRNRFERAASIVDRVRAGYNVARGVRDFIALYQAGTDADLVAAVDAVYTPAQKQELNTVATKMAAFATDMETNHASLIAGA
jgi:hypothetical protein